MTIEEAAKHFGTLYKLCKLLGLVSQNGSKWKKQGYIPLLQQYRISELSGGVLKPDIIDPKIILQKTNSL